MAGKTGPKSEAGKSKSKLNSVSFGLRTKGIMPCRLEKCRHRSMCTASDMMPEEWAKQNYGDPCLIEMDFASKCRESDFRNKIVDPTNPAQCKIQESFIAAYVYQKRVKRAIWCYCDNDSVKDLHIDSGIALDDYPDSVKMKRLNAYLRRAEGAFNKCLKKYMRLRWEREAKERMMKNLLGKDYERVKAADANKTENTHLHERSGA